MRDDVIVSLPDYLRAVKTLRVLSFDKAHKKYMIDSEITAVDFDKISKRYNKWLKCNKGKVRSFINNTNDALYISVEGEMYFIEFKNGNADTAQIHAKIYDSINMLIDFGYLKNLDECRERIQYILVVNEDDYKNKKSESLRRIGKRILEKSKRKSAVLNISKFKNYLFKETYSCNTEEFIEIIADKFKD